MYRVPALVSWLSVSLAVFFVGVSWCAAADVRTAPRPPRGDELPKDESVGDLTKRFKDRDQSKAFEAFKSGKEQPDSKKDQAVLDLAAQWYTYRVTWKHLQEKPTALNNLGVVHQQFDVLLRDIEYHKENQKFRTLFARRLVYHLGKVLDEGNLLGRVNGAILLSRVASLSGPELIDKLIVLLKSPRYEDAVKLYAIKALREQLQRLPGPTGVKGDDKVRADRIAGSFEALKPFLTPALSFDKNTLDSEKQQAREVARYFRCEAIRALAQVRQPAVDINERSGQVTTPIATYLARILADDPKGLTPSLAERVEAAVGLCDERTWEGPKNPYQRDLALYLVGRFIAHKLAPAFREDRDRVAKVVVKANAAKRDVKTEPWRLYAARLRYSLEEMEKAARDNPAFQKQIQSVLEKAEPIFHAMDDIQHRELDAGKMEVLGKAVDRVKPKSNLLFRGLNDTKIDLAESELEE
jgi:hypothetical protein